MGATALISHTSVTLKVKVIQTVDFSGFYLSTKFERNQSVNVQIQAMSKFGGFF